MEGKVTTAALIGIAVGDALGVPYEFRSTEQMRSKPATDMIGYGTHNQPPGTWSDDSSLTFCLADALVHSGDLKSIAARFVSWRNMSYWTPRGEVFDIGGTTYRSISLLENILSSEEYQQLEELIEQSDEQQNGNGSLMRILPLLFKIQGLPLKDQFQQVTKISSLTHRHIRAAMCCQIYLNLAERLLYDDSLPEAYETTRQHIQRLWDEIKFPEDERPHFNRLIQQDIRTLKYKDLRSGGYVIETLEAAFWCLLNTNSYSEAVLAAVNLGHDTDTTAAVVGGIAGIHYGMEGIPEFWIVQLARMEEIILLGDQLWEKFSN